MVRKVLKTKGSSTVLIIEDDEFLLRAYRVKFESEGIDVRTISDGTEAVRRLKDDVPPDLVLLDLMLPNISGYDVLAAMRKAKGWKDVPVIIMSNLSEADDIKKGRALGVKEYFVKAEIRLNDVADKVKEYL